MRNSVLFWLIPIFYAATGYGQGLTGINTINTVPSQQLHVKGTFTPASTQIDTSGIYVVKPTIRIEGLNRTNNTSFAYTLPSLLTTAPYSAAPYTWPASLIQPVSVTQDGDLLLSRDYVLPLIATKLGTDALTATTLTSPLPNPAPGTAAEGSLTGGVGYSFTLNQTCMVHFMASVSVSIYQSGGAAAKTILTDKMNKAYHVHFRFLSKPVASTVVIGTAANNQFGTDGNSYTNTNSGGSPGDMYANPEAYLVLIPGTYKVDLIGRLFGYQFSCDAVFGGGAEDMVSIIATPLN